MRKSDVAVGSVCLVRFKPGVDAKAEITRVLRKPRKTDGSKTAKQQVYEARLIHVVGTFPKGHVFEVRSRSVKKVLTAASNGAPKPEYAPPAVTPESEPLPGPDVVEQPEEPSVPEQPEEVYFKVTTEVAASELAYFMRATKQWPRRLVDLVQ